MGGTLMTISEHTAFPGSPYWLAGIFVFIAHHLADKLPANSDPSMHFSSSLFSPTDNKYSGMSSPPEREYIHELEFKRRYQSRSVRRTDAYDDDDGDCLSSMYPTRT